MKLLVLIVTLCTATYARADSAFSLSGAGNGVTWNSGTLATLQSGATFYAAYGSSTTFQPGGVNAVVKVPGADQDYSSNCPSTITWTFSNYLQPWELAASSIAWRVHYELSFSSTAILVVANFNNDTLKRYSYAGATYVPGVGVSGYNEGPMNSAFGIGLTGDSSVATWSPGLGSAILGDFDFETAVSSSTTVVGSNTPRSSLYSGTTYCSPLPSTNGYVGNAVVTSVQITATTTSPQSGASTHNVPMCGHFELWRGPQHR